MRSVQAFGASMAPHTILLQSDRVRRRIAASDSVAALVASLAYGEPRRGDLSMLSTVTASRCAIYTGAR